MCDPIASPRALNSSSNLTESICFLGFTIEFLVNFVLKQQTQRCNDIQHYFTDLSSSHTVHHISKAAPRETHNRVSQELQLEMLSKLGSGNFKRKPPDDAGLAKKNKLTQKQVVEDAVVSGSGGSSSSSSRSLGPPAESIRQVAADMFLENKLSAVDVSRLARSSKHSGAQGVDDLASAGAHGTNSKNLARDILRTLLKDTIMPSLFWYDVRGWDPENKVPTTVSLPFLLPHEILHSLGSKLDGMILDKAKYPEVFELFSAKCKNLKLDPMSCVPLGFHGDGVPFSKKESLELLSFNFFSATTW